MTASLQRRFGPWGSFKSERGSMPLALFLIVSTTVITVTFISIITWQVSQTRNEQLTREAQLAVDSTMNLAAEALGASGRALLGIPIEEPDDWVDSEIYGVATKWWAIPLNSQDIARTVTPTPFTYTASSGNLAVSVDVNSDIYLTSDGISWIKTGKSPVPSDAISDFTYGRGNFIMTARPNSASRLSSILYYSPNGKDWFTASLFGTDENSAETLAQVDCGNTECVMITGNRDSRTRYWYSANLSGWSLEADTNDSAALPIANDIAYGANRWVVIGHSDSTNEYSFSTDGRTWSIKGNVHASGAADPITQIAYSDSVGFVGVNTGFNNAVNYAGHVNTFGNTDPSSSVVTSEDATSWDVGILPVAQHWSSITGSEDTVMIAAESDSGSLLGGSSILLSTQDGTAWNTRSLPRSDNYSAIAPVGSSWLVTSPLGVYGYLASSDLNRPTLPNEIYLKAIATTNLNADGYTFNKVYRFKWTEKRNRWELDKTYTDLDFSLESRFSITPDDGKLELVDGEATFTFADTSSGAPTSWAWDFGDGTNSSDQNPTKTYMQSGTYTVRLTVTEPGGYSNTFAETVKVQERPSEPRNLTVESTNIGLKVGWGTPISDGQSQIIDYLIRYRQVGTTTWTNVAASRDVFSYTLSGLTERDSYEVEIAARNIIGSSAWVSVGSADPYQPPSEPLSLNVSGLVDMVIAFDAPTTDGGRPISGYRVQYATDGAFTTEVKTIDIRNTSAFIRGFDEFTTYYLRVFAINNAGLSDPSSTATFTTIGKPEAPTTATATAVDNEIFIDWSAPASDGGSAINGYLVEYTKKQNDYDAGIRITTTETDYSFAATPGTTYYIRVRAISAAGSGDPTAQMSATGNTVVQTIPGLTATGQAEAVYLEWTQPTLEQMGGSSIQRYVLSWSAPNGTFNSIELPSNTTAVIVDQEDINGDGLADQSLMSGFAYTFTITATNGVGDRSFNVSGTPTS